MMCSMRAAPAGRGHTAMTSMRTPAARSVCSVSHSAASLRNRASFAPTTASAGWPKASPRRVFTSTKTSSSRCPSRAMMSISPWEHRQFRSRTSYPLAVRIRAATLSPYLPTAPLRDIPPPPSAQPGRHGPRSWRGGKELWTTRHFRPVWTVGRANFAARPRDWCRADQARRSGGQAELGLGKFFDVDVLERDDAHGSHEARRAVDVPHPGVAEGEFEEDLAARGAHLQVDLVGEVEEIGRASCRE